MHIQKDKFRYILPTVPYPPMQKYLYAFWYKHHILHTHKIKCIQTRYIITYMYVGTHNIITQVYSTFSPTQIYIVAMGTIANIKFDYWQFICLSLSFYLLYFHSKERRVFNWVYLIVNLLSKHTLTVFTPLLPWLSGCLTVACLSVHLSPSRLS